MVSADKYNYSIFNYPETEAHVAAKFTDNYRVISNVHLIVPENNYYSFKKTA